MTLNVGLSDIKFKPPRAGFGTMSCMADMTPAERRFQEAVKEALGRSVESKAELAKRAGITRGHLYQLARDASGVALANMISVAKVLGIEEQLRDVLPPDERHPDPEGIAERLDRVEAAVRETSAAITESGRQTTEMLQKILEALAQRAGPLAPEAEQMSAASRQEGGRRGQG